MTNEKSRRILFPFPSIPALDLTEAASKELRTMKEPTPVSVPGRPRVPILDELRGLSILLMVLYHAVYDLVERFGVPLRFFHSRWLEMLVAFFAGVFIFLSGISSRYSRNNFRRGGICLGFAFLLTLVTYWVQPEFPIRFGILHLLGVCILLEPLLRPLTDRLPPWVGTGAAFLLVFLTWQVPDGFIGIPGVFLLQMPSGLYWGGLYGLGFPSAMFISADYFPLIPWGFVFLAGSSFGRLVRGNRLPSWFYRSRLPWLAAVGRHTLLIYLLHQPVLYALFWIAAQI